MKRFDFTQMGGFPLTQDRLEWMQDGYITAINALAGLAGGTNPLSLDGVELTAGSWTTGGTVSDGWVWHPTLGLMPFIGGVFTTTTMGVAYTDLVTPLTFQNNSQPNVQIRRVARIVAGATGQLRDLSQNRWSTQFGKSNQGVWQSGTLYPNYTGWIKSMYVPFNGMVHIKGVVSGNAQLGGGMMPFSDIGYIKDSDIQPPEDLYFLTSFDPGVHDKDNGYHVAGSGVLLHQSTIVASSPTSAIFGRKIRLRGLLSISYASPTWTQYFDFNFKI